VKAASGEQIGDEQRLKGVDPGESQRLLDFFKQLGSLFVAAILMNTTCATPTLS
jgi:hypothetical protein